MNIAILCYHRIGGSGIVAYEIGRAMAEEKGHSVHFVGLEPPFRLGEKQSESMRFHKVWVREYPVFDFQPYSLALASQLSELITQFKIDVIHSHYALPHAVSALLARDISGLKVRCVTTLHGTDITVVGAHPTMLNITRHAILNSDAVTAVSNHLRAESERKLKLSPGKIHTVYNFVNPDNFNPGLSNGGDTGKKIVMHISNLRAVKCPLDVIRIYAGVRKKLSEPSELWVVGEGPMQSRMVTLSEELGIRDSVEFKGIHSDLGVLMAAADLMLLPSQHESFGLAALESMACGVPVVAKRVGGLPELITDGKSGCLFEKGDLRDAIAKATRLLSDGVFYADISRNARKTATETFSMEEVINQYERLYLAD